MDIIPEKVDLINHHKSPIADAKIDEYLISHPLNLTATCDVNVAYNNPELVIIATPTNYDTEKNYFDTTSVENVIETVLRRSPETPMVIKSTIPVGYTESTAKKYNCDHIFFSPEFLREGKALYDNLYPSRIIVGIPDCCEVVKPMAQKFAELLQEGAIKEDIPTLIILDDDRRQNAQLFEQVFYSGKGALPPGQTSESTSVTVTDDAALLMRLLQNPEMASLIKTLAKSLE